MQGYKRKSFTNTRQILFYTNPAVSVGIVVSDVGITPNAEGKRIVKAGTPLTGNLTERTTPFTEAATVSSTSNAVGVLLHDVDVTDGSNNGTLLIDGFVNLERLDDDVLTKITEAVKSALVHVRFLK